MRKLPVKKNMWWPDKADQERAIFIPDDLPNFTGTMRQMEIGDVICVGDEKYRAIRDKLGPKARAAGITVASRYVANRKRYYIIRVS